MLSRFESLGSAQRLQLMEKSLVTIVSDWIFLCRRVLFVFCCRTHRSSAGVPRGPGHARIRRLKVVSLSAASLKSSRGGRGGVTSHGCGAA